MTVNGNAVTANWHMSDAWRGAQEPDAIIQAIMIGAQVRGLLVEAAILVQRARWNLDSIIEDSSIRCQVILDRLTTQVDRLSPILARLRAADKAVIS